MSIQRTPGERPGRSSRWASSQVTFGPVGRLVATVLVCLPVALLLYAGVGVMALPVFAGVLVPWALRDIWRRVPVSTPHASGPTLPSLSERLAIQPTGLAPAPTGQASAPASAAPAPADPVPSTERPQPPRRW